MLLRQTAAFLLLLAVLAQTFSRYFVVANYYLNTAAFAAKCINKDRPWMRCNGRCQLCKKLQQQDSPEDKQSPERRLVQNEPLFSNAAAGDFNPLQIVIPFMRQFSELRERKPVRMPRSLFHPPGDHLA